LRDVDHDVTEGARKYEAIGNESRISMMAICLVAQALKSCVIQKSDNRDVSFVAKSTFGLGVSEVWQRGEISFRGAKCGYLMDLACVALKGRS
jgi:hypothetical protein